MSVNGRDISNTFRGSCLSLRSGTFAGGEPVGRRATGLAVPGLAAGPGVTRDIVGTASCSLTRLRALVSSPSLAFSWAIISSLRLSYSFSTSRTARLTAISMALRCTRLRMQ